MPSSTHSSFKYLPWQSGKTSAGGLEASSWQEQQSLVYRVSAAAHTSCSVAKDTSRAGTHDDSLLLCLHGFVFNMLGLPFCEDVKQEA